MVDARETCVAGGALLVGGQEFKLNLVGQGGFPADATAALLNLTVTEPTAAGYVKVYPCGEENTVSNVNYVAGQTVANLAAVKVAPGGDVCFKSFIDTQLGTCTWWPAPGTVANTYVPVIGAGPPPAASSTWIARRTVVLPVPVSPVSTHVPRPARRAATIRSRASPD